MVEKAEFQAVVLGSGLFCGSPGLVVDDRETAKERSQVKVLAAGKSRFAMLVAKVKISTHFGLFFNFIGIGIFFRFRSSDEKFCKPCSRVENDLMAYLRKVFEIV
jgi:hypothetical protein